MALFWNDLSVRLAEPFAASAVLWRAGSVSRDKQRAQALAYAEPRIYEDRLNEVLGPDWSCRFMSWGEQRLICELTVRYQDEDGEVREITRTSSGEFDSGDRVAQGTAAEAQAFKRACSKFGLGRYLYDLPMMWVAYDESSRRLTEMPALPKWAQPKPAMSEPIPAAPKVSAPAEAKPIETKSVEAASVEVPGATEPTLSRGRADAMQRELEKLGLDKVEQRKLAERVLNHKVTQFSSLTESEALIVWNVAKRTHGAQGSGQGYSHAVGS
jgi:hypothetical protein